MPSGNEGIAVVCASQCPGFTIEDLYDLVFPRRMGTERIPVHDL